MVHDRAEWNASHTHCQDWKQEHQRPIVQRKWPVHGRCFLTEFWSAEKSNYFREASHIHFSTRNVAAWRKGVGLGVGVGSWLWRRNDVSCKNRYVTLPLYARWSGRAFRRIHFTQRSCWQRSSSAFRYCVVLLCSCQIKTWKDRELHCASNDNWVVQRISVTIPTAFREEHVISTIHFDPNPLPPLLPLWKMP